MAKVYLLIGKIASGKTHFAMQLKQQQPLMLLSCDDLLLTLFDHCLGDKHQQIEQKAYRFLFEQAVQLAEMGMDSALDFGFWTAESRREARQFFASHGVQTVWVYCNPPELVRLQRLQQRNQQRACKALSSGRREYIIDQPTLQRLDSRFEPPTPDEYHILLEK